MSKLRAKNRLGRFLTERRNAAGYKLAESGKELQTTDGTLSRYETGEVMPVWATVLSLLNLYKADDGQRARGEPTLGRRQGAGTASPPASRHAEDLPPTNQRRTRGRNRADDRNGACPWTASDAPL